MAHVHIPKPLHGWREFVGEVGIIVLGVLIALGFGQIVEQFQWRQEVRTTRQALSDELVATANQGAERLAVETCLRDRIAELAAKLNATDGRWTADPMRLAKGARLSPHWDERSMTRVYAVPLRGWSHDAWDTAKSTGTLNHISHDELASYSAVYSEIDAIAGLRDQEILLESKLSFLSADQELDNRSRTDVLGTLGQLDALNATIAGLSSLIIQQVKDLHLSVDRTRAAKDLRQSILSEQLYRGTCVKNVQIQF